MNFKIAGLPTQIRSLEKRLKEMDASKISPAKIKEITDTINNLKILLKEKQDKKEQRKKDKEQKAQEVSKEAISVPNATDVGMATTTTTTTPTTPTPNPATPSTAPTPDDQKVSCPLCGGITFNSQSELQQHMEFTHASDIAPTTPGQKEDKLVASIEPVAKEETGPQFKLDDEVKPIRGSESKGKVMRHDSPKELVYVMWESGPLKDRDNFGGYYPHDLKVVQEEQPVEAAMPEEKSVCNECVSMKEKVGDLRSNAEAILKDLKEEREAHYAQGNHAWVARLDQKIIDLQNSINEKFPNEKTAVVGGPRLIRQINKATSGHGYDATEYDLGNGQFKQNVPLKINETKVRMTDPTSTQYEIKYDGMDWRMVAPQEFQQWLNDWKATNKVNTMKEGGAQNAEQLTIMDHTPPRANSGPDDGGKDSHDEFQDEWAMPVTSAQKIAVFNKEFVATPVNDQKKFGGYEISQNGKKLFKINSKDSQPMTKKQLEFCTQIELTRGMKQAKLVEKIAFLEAGSTVYVIAQDKAKKRVKFASLEQGVRGWVSASKLRILALESQPVDHNGHQDKVLGQTPTQTLLDCVEAGPTWVSSTELMDANCPPATPESLNDIDVEGSKKCDICKGTGRRKDIPYTDHDEQCNHCKGTGKISGKTAAQGYPENYFKYALAKERADQFGLGDVEDADLTQAGLVAKKQEMIESHDIESSEKEALKPGLPPQILNRRMEVNAVSNKVSHIRHEDGKWVVWNHDYTKRLGTYGTKEEATKRLRQIEYFKHHGSVRSFSKKAASNFLDSAIFETAIEDYAFDVKDDPDSFFASPEYEQISAIQTIDELRQKFPAVAERYDAYYNAYKKFEPGSDSEEVGEYLEKNITRPPSASESINDLPTLDKGEKMNQLLEQLNVAKDPVAKQKIVDQINRLKTASLKKADIMTDPYQSLSTHINDMRSRMTQVQEKLQNAPAIKTAGDEDVAPEMDLSALFADLTQGIELLETKLGGESTDPEVHMNVEELENKLWELEEKLGLTPELSDEEKAEPEHSSIINEINYKKADQITDESIITNDPNAAVTDPTVAPPTIQNVQPTDDSNLVVPVAMPTSPLPKGQHWQFDTQFNKFVAMPDNSGSQI